MFPEFAKCVYEADALTGFSFDFFFKISYSQEVQTAFDPATKVSAEIERIGEFLCRSSRRPTMLFCLWPMDNVHLHSDLAYASSDRNAFFVSRQLPICAFLLFKTRKHGKNVLATFPRVPLNQIISCMRYFSRTKRATRPKIGFF